MTESKAEAAPQLPKELLALNPEQETEFKKKVSAVKRRKTKKVGRNNVTKYPNKPWSQASTSFS